MSTNIVCIFLTLFSILLVSAGYSYADVLLPVSQIITNDPPSEYSSFGFPSDIGDVNNDGIGDAIVGLPTFLEGGVKNGYTKIFFGNAGAPGTFDTTADIILAKDPPEADANFGRRNIVGDINGDGFNDVIVSAPFADTGAVDTGEVRIFFGSDDLYIS